MKDNSRSLSRSHSAGFTLIEMLVVLVIVGVMATVAGVSIGSGDAADKVKTEARRVRELIRLASDTAVLQSTQIGLVVSQHHYRFVAFKNGHWQPFASSDPLRPRALAAPVELQADTDHRPIPDTVRQRFGGDDVPAIMILSSGGLTPFQLTLSAPDGGTAYRLRGRWDGEVTIKSERGQHG